jgi:TnsA endonuclease N terminal/TnsA endonuclease C terminal
MSVKKHGNLEQRQTKWLKEGRGSGHGSSYLPWITVRDVASIGRSHRIFGHKSRRTHHLLSDLELAIFLMLEWHNSTTDIREQFPLILDETLVLAKQAGIKHPGIHGINQTMSTDFLVNTQDSTIPKFAIQAKYADDLQDARTLEKLELERRYWKSKSIPWFILTEMDIPKVVFENINWLYPAQRQAIDEYVLIDRLDFYNKQFIGNQNQTIIELTRKLDNAYEMEAGECLLELRQLMAHRYFTFNIFIPFRKLTASDLTVSDISLIKETKRVSNQ